MLALGVFTAVLFSVLPACGRAQAPDWQAEVRKYAETKDWDSAIRLVDQEIAQAPDDLDVRAWRARVLAWSGRLVEAEREYQEILKVSAADPDNWMGLAGVYLREGRVDDAQQAVDKALELDPKRADVRAARARVLRAAGNLREARTEFQNAQSLDPTSQEVLDGLASLKFEPKHELRFGQDNDLLSVSPDYHDESVTLNSKWTPRWATSVSGDSYQRVGANAEKFAGSVTRWQPKWGALTMGAAVAHDNAVIPKSEAFFDLDHGLKTSESGFFRALEVDYGQHWYWYQGARILTLNGGALVYLPAEWTFSLRATGARSAFSGTGAEWRPSGVARLDFPVARSAQKRLSGNILFAAGTEDFAIVDQIGRFASQTYGGGLKFQFTARQDITGYAAFQKRTQDGTDTSFGLGYGIRF